MFCFKIISSVLFFVNLKPRQVSDTVECQNFIAHLQKVSASFLSAVLDYSKAAGYQQKIWALKEPCIVCLDDNDVRIFFLTNKHCLIRWV